MEAMRERGLRGECGLRAGLFFIRMENRYQKICGGATGDCAKNLCFCVKCNWIQDFKTQDPREELRHGGRKRRCAAAARAWMEWRGCPRPTPDFHDVACGRDAARDATLYYPRISTMVRTAAACAWSIRSDDPEIGSQILLPLKALRTTEGTEKNSGISVLSVVLSAFSGLRRSSACCLPNSG